MQRPVLREESRYMKDKKEWRIVKVPFIHEENPVHNRQENLEKALSMLKEALGDEWATNDPALCAGYARDQSYTPATYPHVVCLPGSTEEVQAVYRIANECLVDVLPYGTGISTMGATIPLYGGVICDLRRMDEILEIDPDNMYARIQPGVNYCELQAEAQKVGLRVANPSTSATAGVISNHGVCNINTMCSKYGFGMDNIIETKMVLPDGEILEAGPMACGMLPAHVQGPGPDIAPLFRYSSGTLGIVTEMTVRLFPEPEFSRRFYSLYGEDDLTEIVEALYGLARENLSVELVHVQDTFFGILSAPTNKESGLITQMMPRNNIVAIVGGYSPEEVRAKTDIFKEVVTGVSEKFQVLEQEVMDELMAGRMDPERTFKYFRDSVRIQRVRGSFLIGALMDHLDNLLEPEKAMRSATTSQIGTTDDDLRPDDASGMIQPYHMGRVAYMEYDLLTKQNDRDETVRSILGYFRASFTALGRGCMFAAGLAMLLKGMPMLDTVMPMVLPNLKTYLDTFTAIKKDMDPNNVSNRRWDYETDKVGKIMVI